MFKTRVSARGVSWGFGLAVYTLLPLTQHALTAGCASVLSLDALDAGAHCLHPATSPQAPV